MSVYPFQGRLPVIAPDAWIAPGARVIGNVTIGSRSSIWFNCVLRGDINTIDIGTGTNLQDGTVVHVSSGRFRTVIGNDILIGHTCIIHGCELQDTAFVGMGAVVMDGCVVEPDAMVAAGALVTPGTIIRRGEIWAGRPARFMRKLAEKDFERQRMAAIRYADNAQEYLRELGSETGRG